MPVAPHASSFLSGWFTRGRLRPSLQATACAVTAALAVTLGVAAEPAAAVTPPAAKPAARKVSSRPDVVSAQVTARAQGSRVEVEGLRDETSTTWVNPDGTLTTEQHQGPIRYREDSGKDVANPQGPWRDVDLVMVENADGTVGPKGHPGGLSLAGSGRAADGAAKGSAGTDVAAAHEQPGKDKATRQVTFGWGGDLGKPVLAGTTATYQHVKPGVDLVVDARRSGFETHLVINTAEALTALKANSASPLSWSIPIKTKGLTARAEKDGSVSFVAQDGQIASTMAAPIAWDAAVDERSGNHVSESPVAMTVAQKGNGNAVLTLTPDQGWLFDSARVFPVTIDPTYASGTVTTSLDTYVSSLYPTANYNTATELRVGTYNGGGDKYRSFLNFPVAGIAGKQIISASLSLYEFHSWSCTARTFNVYTSGATGSGTTWNTQPAALTSSGALSVAKGFSSSCAAGRVSVPITAAIQGWAGSGWVNGSLRLSASETDNYAWKKFYSLESTQDPYITFTYNRKPNAASAPTMEAAYTPSYLDPRDNKTYLFTTDTTPQFYSKATDPDASTVSVTFEVHNSTAGTAASKVSSCATGYGASGASVYCSPTTVLTNNTYYYVRAAVKDDQGLWNGTWSPWTQFGTAYNNPPAPVISCPGYTDGSWTDNAPTADVVCTVKATGIANDWSTPGYLDLTVDGVVVHTRLKITPTNDPAVVATTFTIAKTKAGSHIITATAVARTLKTTAKTLSFGWGGASLTMPTVGTASSGKITVTAGGPPRGTSTSVSGKIQWRVAGSGTEIWTDGPALTVVSPNATTPVTTTTTWSLSSAIQESGAPAPVSTRVPVLLDVQVCFTYAGVATPQCTWSQSARSVTRVPHAFGNGYPTAAAGLGQVALFTGEFNTSATDVSVPGYSGDLAISRTHTSFDGDGSVANWPVEPVTGVFGPGWTASLQGPEAGVAGLQVIDNTRQDGTIVLVDEEGSPLVYRNPDKTRAYKPGAPYLPATTDTTEAAADLQINGTVGATMTMTFKQEDGTVTTWAPVAYSAGADTDWKPVSVNEPGQVGSTTYGHDGTGRVTRIVAAVPPNGATPPAAAVTCPTSGDLVAPQYRGCRALDITYATANSATFPGDYAGRVKAITATLWDPEAAAGAGAMTNTTVATYTYDITGRLVQVRDPRTTLGTDYTWSGTSTRLAAVKQSGMAAYNLSYDATPGTPRVAAVTRDNPTTGTGSPVTLARYTYGVALSGTGLPDLTGTAVDDWYQGSAPATGYAVFGPDYIGPTGGAGVDWSRADLQYADENGYTVNTASYGAGAWQVTATDYDTTGNVVRGLDAGATKIVRDAASGSTPLGSGQVDALSTQSVYNTDITGTVDEDGAGPLAPVTKVVTPAGTLVTDTYGPTRTAALVSDLNSDGLPDVLPVRPHTKTVYDFNAPTSPNGAGINPANNEPWRLPTTITTGVATPGQVDLETTFTTVNSYAKLSAGDATEGDPWAIGTPTKVTTGGITATTRFDNEGKTTEARQPLSTGIDAGTTKTNFYTAGVNAADTSCGTNIEWAGLACRTYPAAAPTAGAGGAATLPDSRTTAYNAWLQPLTVVETSGTATRTTQTQYDTAGRTTATWTTTSGVTGSTASPGTFTHYIPPGQTAAGSVDYSGNLNAAKTDADPTARTSTTYDAWGRTLTATNDLGDVTTTTYVAIGQPGAGSLASVVENPAAAGQPDQTTAYTYDGAGSPEGKDADNNLERRGQLTGMTITRAGAAGGTGTLDFAAAYDADGKLVTQKLPGQVTQRTSYDEAGEPSGLTYSGSVQPVKIRLDTEGTPVADEFGNPIYDPDGAAQPDQPWLAWTVRNDTQGRVRTEFTGAAAGFDGNPGVSDPADITAYDAGHAIGFDRNYSYDGAGRLTTVTDQTATAHGADLNASPCAVRSYGFDSNGRRTTLSSAVHGDGNCTGTTAVTTTSSNSNFYDTADRPTTGVGGTGQYVYDALGRQTTIPALDTPAYPANPNAGDITLGYFDDDLPRTVTQGGTSTTLTLDSSGRRQQATTTTGTQTSTLVRHYTGGDDNPAWTVATDPLGQATTTRYAESIGGDLGTSIAADGAADLTLATLHGDVVTTIAIPAAQPGTAAAAGIDGWSDYTEYGTPRDPAATTAVGGTAGYGWLGAKQRSTTAETAGLTLMGDRLYNPVTGRFTSPDPEPGGNPTAYTYPTDPINMFDLDGHWGISKKWKERFGRAAGGLSWASHIVGYCPLAQCQAASLGLGLASAGAYAFSGQRSKARSQLASTVWSVATGGRGKWVKASSRFSKVNTRFGGLNGLAHRSYSRKKVPDSVRISRERSQALLGAGLNHLGGYMGQY